MIKLIITIFGGLMIIAGFYAMYWGFAIPPNIFLFFLGLILAVAGLFLIILFSSGIEMPQRGVSTPQRTVPSPTPVMKARPKPVKVEKEKKVSKEEKKRETLKTIEKIKPQPRIKKPKKVERPGMSTKPVEVEKPSEPIGTREIKPKRKADIGKTSTSPPAAAFKPSSEVKKQVEKPVEEEPVKPGEQELEKFKPVEVEKPEIEPAKPEVEKAEPVKAEPTKPEAEPVKPKPVPRITRPDKKKPKEQDKLVEQDDTLEKPVTEPVEEVKTEKEPKEIVPVKTEEPKKPPVLKRPDLTKLRSNSARTKEDTYVKQRLEKMKASYIQNTKDIESIIDERMDSFKGTLGKLKNESKEPGIIWSFDADDVQNAMKETISRASNRILMMYPWIRNIDIGILKKFMDTESRIIVQEASLDDDASVELLKLLQDKEVKIRTMPHVHTIAVVADDSNGLIISTDPIYESYEVGVVYKDQKSIEEIERMFEDAWDISQDIDLEIK